MKKALLLLAVSLIIAFNSFSQTVYLADTAFTTDVGYGGAPASCIANGGYWFGLGMNSSIAYSLGDFFTIPTGATWIFDTVIVFGYRVGSDTTSPFTSITLGIYQDGPPGLGGTLIWGDSVTNIIAGTGFTGIYRVDTVSSSGGLLNTQRPIMYIKAFLSPTPTWPPARIGWFGQHWQPVLVPSPAHLKYCQAA